MSDNVSHPAHYSDKKIEVITYIEDTLSPEGYVDYCLGNVLKYVFLPKLQEDLEKAQVYLTWAIEKKKKIDAEELAKLTNCTQ